MLSLLGKLPAALLRPSGADALARVRAWATSQGHASLAQRMAGTAFLIRVASAACVYLTQIVLARWMGSFEFGVYVYVWTWVLLLGDLIHLGLAPAAQRFIPLYMQQNAFDRLRGFVSGSRWLVLSSATGAALLAAAAVRIGEPWLHDHTILPLYLACMALPAYALCFMLDGIARSYNWVGLALLPPFILRPLILIALMVAAYQFGIPADATTAMMAMIIAAWIAVIVQAVWLNRRLGRTVPAGPKTYEVSTWLKASLPILMVCGFYTLLTYTDILVLQLFRPPDEIALYYAASKTLALVAFVYFSVSAAVAHRFSEYHAAGDRVRLAEFVAASIRWTFWPSLAATVIVLALGKPFLWLFGPGFVEGYPLMFVLAAGLLARSAVGPAERLLNMLGEQRICAVVYATAFTINISLCFALIPRLGVLGAALATTTALVCESILLFVLARTRLGIHAFVWRWADHARAPAAMAKREIAKK